MRDYLVWHEAYDDPDSGLSWRLRAVQEWITEFLDERQGDIRIVSVCAGDGRDLLDVLEARPQDRRRVEVTLLEIEPALATRARERAAGLGLDRFEVRDLDAGTTDSYRGAVPADLVVLVGILGNISEADVVATIESAAQFCAAGATLIWSRGRDLNDLNDLIRSRLAGCGFVETGYAERNEGSRPALGRARFDGAPEPLAEGQQLFTFLR